MIKMRLSLLLASSVGMATDAFVNHGARLSSSTQLYMKNNAQEDNVSRREAFGTAASVFGTLAVFSSASQEAWAVDDDGIRGGVKLTPFNGLTFNYRGNDFGGLDASELNEASVPYKEFLERLDKGEVEFVEFAAPDGDRAYVTFKNEKPIRIGEGYPIEQHDGWSSPAFVVKSVKKNGVPYKFVVPGLDKYK